MLQSVFCSVSVVRNITLPRQVLLMKMVGTILGKQWTATLLPTQLPGVQSPEEMLPLETDLKERFPSHGFKKKEFVLPAAVRIYSSALICWASALSSQRQLVCLQRGKESLRGLAVEPSPPQDPKGEWFCSVST